MEDFETELTKCSIKQRWESIRECRKIEGDRVAQEIKNIDPEKEVKKNNDKVYDHNTKSMDVRNLKATDLKSNKRVILPDLEADENEIKRNHVKNELKEVFIRYKNNNCDKFGNVLRNNLTKKQVEAIGNLKKKISEDGLVCYETDKTGKLALDTIILLFLHSITCFQDSWLLNSIVPCRRGKC